MPEDDEGAKGPGHPSHHWGAMAEDPWADLVPEGPEWRRAVRRSWERNGGSAEDFAALFGALARREPPR